MFHQDTRTPIRCKPKTLRARSRAALKRLVRRALARLGIETTDSGTVGPFDVLKVGLQTALISDEDRVDRDALTGAVSKLGDLRARVVLFQRLGSFSMVQVESTPDRGVRANPSKPTVIAQCGTCARHSFHDGQWIGGCPECGGSRGGMVTVATDTLQLSAPAERARVA